MAVATNPRLENNNGDKLELAIAVSIAFHLAVFAVLAVRAVFAPPPAMDVLDSIKVDIVALPDKAQAPPLPVVQPPPAPPAPKVPEPAVAETKPPEPVKPAPPVAQTEAPKVNLLKSKREQESALQRLAALEKLKKLSNPSSNSSDTRPNVPVPPPIKGNEISNGNALKGLAKLENANYKRQVQSIVKRSWALPQWMVNASLSARVRIFLDAQGNVVKKSITRPSKDPNYDERVLRTIESVSPLPPPPGDLANLLAIEGMEIDFVPD